MNSRKNILNKKVENILLYALKISNIDFKLSIFLKFVVIKLNI